MNTLAFGSQRQNSWSGLNIVILLKLHGTSHL